MKPMNTLALIAGAMVITTEAVKLKDEEKSLAERFVEILYEAADYNRDGNLDADEL